MSTTLDLPNNTTTSYSTPIGHALIKKILGECNPPVIPHDYQTEGISRALDGEDLIATMATGTGKTGLFSFLMLVVRAISEKPTLALGTRHFPKNPCMLIISPTKALENDMSQKMTDFGLCPLVINSDTVSQARTESRNLWTMAEENPNILILSPEELSSAQFAHLLEKLAFFNRLCLLGIDEIHLLHWWGNSFRLAFQQIGHLRARLPTHNGKPITLIGTTATLRVGPTLNAVYKILGLKPGQFHLIRRSNMRHDIQLIFREMKSGIGGTSFPELDWVLNDSEGQTVIFCKTISLGFRVAVYLWWKGRSIGLSDLHQRIRLYNSLNWVSFNAETMEILNNNSLASIVIATDVLSVGWDSQNTRNAIVFGEPPDVDEFVQKIGRIGRNRRLVQNPRAFLYYTRTALATAQRIVDEYTPFRVDSSAPSSFNRAGVGPTDTMDISTAHLLLAPCKVQEIDSSYDNPQEDEPCLCARCMADPPIERPRQCTCNGDSCQPEVIATDFQFVMVEGDQIQKPKTRRGEAISKEMRTQGVQKLEEFRNQIFQQADEELYGFLPPHAFIPNDTIQTLIDKIYSFESTQNVHSCIKGNNLLEPHSTQLYEVCLDIRAGFDKQREESKAKKKGIEEDMPQLMIDENREQGDPDELEIHETSSTLLRKLKINFRNATIELVN